MSLTNEGEVLGSLAYMDPEYLKTGDDALDPQCDLYGLGVVLYEGLSKTYPYGSPGCEDMVVRVLKEDPVPLAQVAKAVPKRVAQVIDKACAKDRVDRFATAGDLATALEALT